MVGTIYSQRQLEGQSTQDVCVVLEVPLVFEITLSQETLRKMEQQMEERFNQRMGIIEQRFMEQLQQQQQQIQITLEEKLQSMQQQNMEYPTQAPTA